jgi:acyl-coenzyme A thioesterase PaaI-like protein
MDAPTGETTGRYGLVPAEVAASMSGLELLQGMIAGRFPGPPIMQLIGFRLAEVASGRAVFEGVPEFKHYNPLGSVHGGYAATLLDSACGIATHSTPGPGRGPETSRCAATSAALGVDARGRPPAVQGTFLRAAREEPPAASTADCMPVQPVAHIGNPQHESE